MYLLVYTSLSITVIIYNTNLQVSIIDAFLNPINI